MAWWLPGEETQKEVQSSYYALGRSISHGHEPQLFQSPDNSAKAVCEAPP